LLAEHIGVEVIIDKGNFAGGYCTVHTQRKVVLNRLLPLEAKASKLAQSLLQFSLDDVSIKPILREFIEREKERSNAKRVVQTVATMNTTISNDKQQF
jgi:hypothetical protein